jgi:hypothetical protein
MGPLPAKGVATVDEIAERQRLLEHIEHPLSDHEASLMATVFGPDNGFSLAWTMLHMIETAPAAVTAEYGGNGDWVDLLRNRQDVSAARSVAGRSVRR